MFMKTTIKTCRRIAFSFGVDRRSTKPAKYVTHKQRNITPQFLLQLFVQRGAGRYIPRNTFAPFVYNRVLQREKVGPVTSIIDILAYFFQYWFPVSMHLFHFALAILYLFFLCLK